MQLTFATLIALSTIAAIDLTNIPETGIVIWSSTLSYDIYPWTAKAPTTDTIEVRIMPDLSYCFAWNNRFGVSFSEDRYMFLEDSISDAFWSRQVELDAGGIISVTGG